MAFCQSYSSMWKHLLCQVSWLDDGKYIRVVASIAGASAAGPSQEASWSVSFPRTPAAFTEVHCSGPPGACAIKELPLCHFGSGAHCTATLQQIGNHHNAHSGITVIIQCHMLMGASVLGNILRKPVESHNLPLPLHRFAQPGSNSKCIVIIQ